MADRVAVYCRRCGTMGVPAMVPQGRGDVELLLWAMFCLPGLIYSVWRWTNELPTCRKCGSKDLIPGDSPVAMAANARE